MEMEFNTGRLYAENGQVIRAKLIDHDRIAFADISRHITGIIHSGYAARAAEIGESEFRDLVQTAYDSSLYAYDKTQDETDAIRDLRKRTWCPNN